MLTSAYLDPITPPLFIYVYLFQMFILLASIDIDDINTYQYQNFSNLIWEKHVKNVKKDPYIGGIVHKRYILLIF